MSDRLLKKADESFDTNGWSSGYLVDPAPHPGREGHAHCALGAIGYAKWGDQYDNLVLNRETIVADGQSVEGDGYTVLCGDPETRKALHALTMQIREHRGFNNTASGEAFRDTPFQARAQVSEIYGYNDNGNATLVRAAFRGAISRLKAAVLSALRKGPKETPVKVEYHPAGGQSETIKEEIVEEVQ